MRKTRGGVVSHYRTRHVRRLPKKSMISSQSRVLRRGRWNRCRVPSAMWQIIALLTKTPGPSRFERGRSRRRDRWELRPVQ